MGRQINDFRPTATGLALALKLKKKKGHINFIQGNVKFHEFNFVAISIQFQRFFNYEKETLFLIKVLSTKNKII
jgi:hypothetical protein